jgi:hypothetical protein
MSLHRSSRQVQARRRICLRGSSQTASTWRFADGSEYFIYKFVTPAGAKVLTLSCEMWNEYLLSATSTAPSVQQGNPNFRGYIVAAQASVFWLDPEDATQAALFTWILKNAQPDTFTRARFRRDTR